MSAAWCILRMSSGNTLPVATALADAGFEVWTPVETVKRRVGRKREVRETTLPITPGIVFARDDRLQDLVAMCRAPALTYRKWSAERKRMEMHGCPSFSVFRHGGRFTRVADRHLDPLRIAEQQAAPRDKVPAYVAGDEVRHSGAGFDGLIGIVQQNRRQYALVMFPGFVVPVKVLASRLLAAKAAA